MIRFAENLNKMITAGLGGALEAPRTEVAVGHRVRYMEASGAVANFETNIAAPIRSLRVDMLPIQAGSGDPSPDNIRPITGRESVTAWRTGKNLINDSIKTVSGNFLLIGATTSSAYPFKLKAGTYRLTVFGTNYVAGYIREQNDTRFTIFMQNGNTGTATIDKDGDYRIALYGERAIDGSVSGVVLTYGTDTISDYEPYDGTSVTVQLGQTVYGGTLDVSTGKLAVTHGEIASYNGEVLTGEWMSDRDVYAAGTTPTIGAQVVYVLDTPQTIDLDPQQIATLKGTNNVWSNSGDVTLDYPYYEETEGY